MLRENLSINITPGGVPVVIHISQYDIGLRTFVFTPYTTEGTFTADTAASATLEGTKPDGNAFVHNCSYNSSTGVITYTVQDQLAAVAGKVWSKLVIRNTSGNAIGYAAIIWVVDMAGVQDGAIMSDSDISALQEFVNEFGSINAYRGALNGALAAVGGPLVAATAAAMTDRTKVYVYTGSETGYTSGHWYYWNGSAWTDGGVYQSTGINTDTTLTVAGMAADAKATGDAVTELENETADILKRSATPIDLTFKSGAINAGVVTPSTSRAYSVWNYVHDGDRYAVLNTTYEYNFGFAAAPFFSSSNTITWTGWLSSNYVIPSTRYGLFTVVLVRKRGSTTADISGELSNIAASVKYFSKYCEFHSNGLIGQSGGIVDMKQCIKGGWYGFSAENSANITDKPTDFPANSEGTLISQPFAFNSDSSTYTLQTLYDANLTKYVRIVRGTSPVTVYKDWRKSGAYENTEHLIQKRDYNLGGLTTDGGFNITGITNRVYTKVFKVPSDAYLYVAGTVQYRIAKYSSSFANATTFIEYVNAWSGDNRDLSDLKGTYIRIMLRYSNDADIDDVKSFYDLCNIRYSKNKLLPLSNMYLAVMGDSISSYQGHTPTGYPYYYTGSNAGVSDYAQMWFNVLCAETGMETIIVNAYSGSGVTQLEDSGHVNAIPMSSTQRTLNGALGQRAAYPDVIIIEGGLNDYTYAQSAQSEPLAWDGKTNALDLQNFTQQYALMIKRIQSSVPNAIIVCLSTPFTMRGTNNGTTYTHTVGANVYTQDDYDRAIEHVCDIMGVPFIDIRKLGFNKNNFYPTYANDSSTEATHPNAYGHAVMGKYIAEKLVDIVNAYIQN